MIVFTITNTVTDQVYVGTTRDSIDTRWQQILSATESGLEAELYTDIRTHGAEHFDMAEWAEAEGLQELRELTQEAMDTLGATSLQGLRTTAPAVKTRRTKPTKAETLEQPSLGDAAESIFASRSVLDATHDDPMDGLDSFDGLEFSSRGKELEESPAQEPATAASQSPTPATKPAEKSLQQMAHERDAQLASKIAKERAAAAEMAKLMARIDSRKRGSKTTKNTPTGLPSAAKPKATASSSPKLSSGRLSSATQERKLREAISQERDARIEEKIAKQKAEATEMARIMARIDARKAPKKTKTAAAKKRSSATEAAKPVLRNTTSRPALAAKSTPALTEKPKLAVGRLSSAAREKKIREAIANEKAARQAEKLSRQTAQADEMAAILARLDNRAKSMKRR